MTTRPNILLLFADQMRPFELGCHGGGVATPNLDRLAALGVRFETAITTNPLCTPARSSLLSGQYARTCAGMLGCCGEPARHRVNFPDATLPERLGLAGVDYETILHGKWHIQSHPRCCGFQRSVYPKVHHLNRDQLYFDGSGRSWIQRGYGPDYEVALSEAVFRETRERPFFLFHNLSLPHMPYFDVPERYRTRYDPAAVELRANTTRDGVEYYDEQAFLIYLYDYLYYKEKRPGCQQLPAGFGLRELTALYWGMIAAADDQVGALLDALEDSGRLEETIIVFASDHGDNLGSHHRWNKHSPNDEAIRIPFFIAWPGVLEPRVVTGQVASLADVAPTLLALAGQPVPATMQGRDLSPVLRGEVAALPTPEAYAENIGGELIVRTPTHMAAVTTAPGPGAPTPAMQEGEALFFDMEDDPLQLRNLAGSGAQAACEAALHRRLARFNEETPWMPGSRGGIDGAG